MNYMDWDRILDRIVDSIIYQIDLNKTSDFNRDEFHTLSLLQISRFVDPSAFLIFPACNEHWNREVEDNTFYAVSGDHVFDNYHDYALHRLDLDLERRHKRRPDLSKERIFELMNGLDSDSIEYTLWEMNHEPAPDKSNIFNHKGQAIDVTKLSKEEIFQYLITIDETPELMNLEHVRSLFHTSTPSEKVYYPEPFVASPSFTHDDIFFIHILQYQFWLWFMFIFLIVFFFVSFLCTVRWCAVRSQPRRETRGVSRSKCGDLITAIVPVTWAISIIVSESTDASDTYDGFATKEIMVGIRAYQWGWEYYYPKGINLQYNVKPSYSAFIGNSLKYSTTSELSLSANNVWKQYQNKATDVVLTPAHLLVLPVDNKKLFNFMNFDNIGARTANESSAFTKIRTHSKTFSTNLVHTPSIFLDKYKQINALFENENKFTDSLSYGLKRQHNLTSSAATASNNANFLDREGMESFLEHTLKFSIEKQKTESFDQDLLLGRQFNTLDIKTQDQHGPSAFINNDRVDLFLTQQSSVLKDSDPIKSIDSFSNESILSDNNETLVTKVINPTSSFQSASNDESILSSDQSIRKMIEQDPRQSHLNHSARTNAADSNLNNLHYTQTGDDLLSQAELSSVKHMDQLMILKLSANRVYTEAPNYPIISNNPQISSLNYDSPVIKSKSTIPSNGKVTNTHLQNKSEVVTILQGRREGSLAALNSNYWQMFWANSNPDLRINSVLQSAFDTDSSYIPLFTNYYDYDFRNAQALELLEESFWETSYSSYNHLDYLNINEAFKKTPYVEPHITRLDSYYYDENTEDLETTEDLMTPAIQDISLMGQFYANAIQSDESFSQASLISTKDFSNFPLIGGGTGIDDSYVNAKGHNLFINHNNNFSLNTSSDLIYPQSYISVLNNFRSDFDDFSIHTETINSNLVDEDLTSLFSISELSDENDLSTNGNNTTRFSNPITLRTTARNSIVTYNALQKVFKARFEEGRSNIKMSHFSDLRTKQPFMNESRIPYEKLLGKNKSNFYNNTFYSSDSVQSFNQFSVLSNSLNTWFFDFPFLLGMSADGSRHFWFDWFAQWGMMEVQPSSLSKYSTLGVPYIRKNYDFNLDSGDKIQAADSYLTRMSRARKNYIPNWLYTPYLYTRSQVWNKTNLTQILFHHSSTHTGHSLILTQKMKWYWSDQIFSNNTSDRFTPSISGNNIYNKATWRPKNSIQSYHYHNALLVDLLTKREYIYRQYFETNKKIISLPKVLTANPKHPLIRELKSSFLFIDPTTYNSEYSREVYYNSLDYFKFMILKGWLLQLDQKLNSTPINTNLVNEYLFYYFFTPQTSSKIGNNQDLYKSQFRPMKKGITTMLRLHATGAVALPIEIRLQILASSRDVIHSWSVPSAGVKIDCVPGYTSHRIMTFLTPGIYWGQCQEICGRYHHWMPIVVYFMKRDLFFLWCTHFLFRNSTNGSWSASDRQFNDYIKFASHDKASWLSEVSKKF